MKGRLVLNSWALLLCIAFLVPPSLEANDVQCSIAQRESFVVAIDIGHTPKQPGATSARGVKEYDFNRRLADVLHRSLTERGFIEAFLIDPQGTQLTLQARTRRAEARNADLLISVHHDSVQPHYLKRWTHAGEMQRYSDDFHGYSIFYSQKNPESAASFEYALALGAELRSRGFVPSLHHAEPIPGENRPLVDAYKGVYRFDDLIVLRTASMPALLLEAGIIVNRDEELRLSDPAYQKRLADTIADAVLKISAGCMHVTCRALTCDCYSYS